MKTFIVILVVLAIFFGLACWNTAYLTRTSKQLASQAEKIHKLVREEAWDDVKAEMMQIRRLWGRHKKAWLLLVDHDDIDNIDRIIFRVDEMIRQEDRKQSLAEIAELRFFVQDVADKEVLSLANIF